jgi:hypothetical protein
METEQVENELITIAGGVEFEVTLLDGTKETVKVRQIPISKLKNFITTASFGNMAEEIDLYCDKQNGWADSLMPDSAIAVAKKGQEINHPFLKAWFDHQANWKKTFEESGFGAGKTEETPKVSVLGNSVPQSPTTTS